MIKFWQTYEKAVWMVPNSNLLGEKRQFRRRKTGIWSKENESKLTMYYHLGGVIPPGHSDEESLRAMLTPLIAMLSWNASATATPKINFFHLYDWNKPQITRITRIHRFFIFGQLIILIPQILHALCLCPSGCEQGHSHLPICLIRATCWIKNSVQGLE